MKNLNEQDFSEFINSDEKVIVDFWAPWCGPCKSMMPILESAEAKAPSRIAKVNVDENPEIAAKFGIRSIPTMIVFQKSQVLDKKVGAIRSSDEISLMLN
jgi:thioredoxin 1